MKTITWKEAVALMDGIAFIIAGFRDELGIEVEDVVEVTRSAFERYCELEEIEAVKVE